MVILSFWRTMTKTRCFELYRLYVSDAGAWTALEILGHSLAGEVRCFFGLGAIIDGGWRWWQIPSLLITRSNANAYSNA